jgi:hypothetical protein
VRERGVAVAALAQPPPDHEGSNSETTNREAGPLLGFRVTLAPSANRPPSTDAASSSTSHSGHRATSAQTAQTSPGTAPVFTV